MIDEIVTKGSDVKREITRSVKDYVYYIVIAVISILVIFVPPLVLGGINGDIALYFPETVDGWVLWGIINGSTSIGNMSFLFLFKQQAKKNASKNPNYIEAEKILHKMNGKKEVFIPRSPRNINAKDYIKKSIFIVTGTIASFVTISSIVIAFDVVTLISTLISVIVALAISWTTMIKDEQYWTEEYLLYAQYVQKKEMNSQEEKEQVEPEKEEKENA